MLVQTLAALVELSCFELCKEWLGLTPGLPPPLEFYEQFLSLP